MLSIVASCVLMISFFISQSKTTAPPDVPRQGDLLFYYPLNIQSLREAVVGNRPLEQGEGAALLEDFGPNGIVNDAYTVKNASKIGYYGNVVTRPNAELTFAFWHLPTANPPLSDINVAIMRIAYGTFVADLYYKGSDLFLDEGEKSENKCNGNLIAGKWQFLAITIKGSDVKVHYGSDLTSVQFVELLKPNYSGAFDLGAAWKGGWIYPRQGDGFSCFSIHAIALEDADIDQLLNVCNQRYTSTTMTTTISATTSPPTSPMTTATSTKPTDPTTLSIPLSTTFLATTPTSTSSSIVSQTPASNSDRLLERSVDSAVKADIEAWVGREPDPYDDFKLTASHVKTKCSSFDPELRSTPYNNGEPTEVAVALEITRLVSFDSASETVNFDANLVMKWSVTTCPWFEVYEQMPELRETEPVVVPHPDEVWNPQLRLLTAASDPPLINDEFGHHVFAVADIRKPNQTFRFVSSHEGHLDSACELDLSIFPFDTQSCWLRFAMKLPATLSRFSREPLVSWKEDVETSEWRFIGQTAHIDSRLFIGSEVSVANFRVFLKRNPSFYYWNYYLPACLLGAISATTFLVPPDAPDRPAIVVTIQMAMAVSQASVMGELPKTSQRNPLTEFIQQMSIFTAVLTIYHVVACWIANMASEKMVKICGKKLSAVRLADALCFLLSLAGFLFINSPIWKLMMAN